MCYFVEDQPPECKDGEIWDAWELEAWKQIEALAWKRDYDFHRVSRDLSKLSGLDIGLIEEFCVLQVQSLIEAVYEDSDGSKFISDDRIR